MALTNVSGPFQSYVIFLHPLVLSLSKDALVVRQAPAGGGRSAP